MSHNAFLLHFFGYCYVSYFMIKCEYKRFVDNGWRKMRIEENIDTITIFFIHFSHCTFNIYLTRSKNWFRLYFFFNFLLYIVQTFKYSRWNTQIAKNQIFFCIFIIRRESIFLITIVKITKISISF